MSFGKSAKKVKIIKNYDIKYKTKISTFDLAELIEEEEIDVLFSSSTFSSSSSEWITLRLLLVPLDIIISSPASET